MDETKCASCPRYIEETPVRRRLASTEPASGWVRSEVSHPNDKSKDVVRIGHGAFVRVPARGTPLLALPYWIALRWTCHRKSRQSSQWGLVKVSAAIGLWFNCQSSQSSSILVPSALGTEMSPP